MDQGTWEGIGTLLAMLAFIAVTVWAYSGRNKARFDEAAMLPFADDLPAAQQRDLVDEKTGIDETVRQPTTDTKEGGR